jgi:hypothetical protein
MSVIVPTVDRGLLPIVFCSIEMTGEAEHEVDIGLRDLRHEPLRDSRATPCTAAGPRREWCRTRGSTAGAGESCDDDQLVARDLERDVLEVVHARALHGDGRAGGGSGLLAL